MVAGSAVFLAAGPPGCCTRAHRLISGMPTGRLRARLTSMADQTGVTVIAVDPAYTSKWAAQHWQKPLTGAVYGAALTLLGLRLGGAAHGGAVAGDPHGGQQGVRARPGGGQLSRRESRKGSMAARHASGWS